ncbi:toxin-antitoxin system, antitoxin component [Capnocytophaga cynodegmi]|uniref:toxin-antitoxin system, antitoxin component n=1 Tax=Capnocytophaga cynodegmi TaxID=28189 RepID=UPI001BB3AFC6|nr:toxin-antitoxin system, antitoxin component [Capnocytophaga cynodegmi]
MKTITMTAQIDPSDVPVFQAILKKFKAKKVSFSNTEKSPNKTTLKAMEEAEQIIKDKNRKNFRNVDEFLHFLKN